MNSRFLVLLLGLAGASLAVQPGRAEWCFDTVPGSAGCPLDHRGLALDGEDRPHLGYVLPDAGGLVTTYWNGAGWSSEVIAGTEDAAAPCQLRLDAEDLPWLAYGATPDRILRIARWNGEAWTSETVDDRAGSGIWFDLALDRVGRPQLAYSVPVETERYDLRCAVREADGWRRETVVTQDNFVGHVSLAVDRDGRRHIGFSGSQLDLWYATDRPGFWEFESLTAHDYHCGEWTSIAIDRDDRPRIVHHKWDRTWIPPHMWFPGHWAYFYFLEELRQEESDWAIADAGDLGQQGASLAVDPLGQSVIAAGGQAGVYILRRSGDELERIDLLPGADWPSLALTSSGHPFVAYVGYDSPPIELAYWKPEVWYDLLVPDRWIGPGDRLDVLRRFRSRAAGAFEADEYLILQAGDQYWFWPDWSREPGSRVVRIDSEIYREELMVSVPWPAGAGSLSGLRFWGVLADPGTFDVRAYDMVEWSFHEP